MRGSDAEILARLSKSEPRKPGRPKPGVTAREVTLLPRHWDWLNSQPGGASVTLRKLVDAARNATSGRDRQPQAQEAVDRFMMAMAGNEPHYKERRGRFMPATPSSSSILSKAGRRTCATMCGTLANRLLIGRMDH